jgi:hypothetical protein
LTETLHPVHLQIAQIFLSLDLAPHPHHVKDTYVVHEMQIASFFHDRGYSPFFIKRGELQVSYERTLIVHITNH